MATSVDVVWTRTIVYEGETPLYRLQTECSNPSASLRDAALFVYALPADYRQVAMVGDLLTYWPANPPVRRLNFDAETTITDDHIGHVATQTGSGDTGVLLGFSANKKTWYIAPDTSDDTFDPGSVVTVAGPPSAVTGTPSTVTGDTHYMSTTADVRFTTPQEAEDAEALQKSRLQNLMTDWEAHYGDFPGTTSETITS